MALKEKFLFEKFSETDTETPSRTEVWRMFDRIAHRYDLLNRLLSFGRDVVWRKKVADHLRDVPDQYVLDLATGTADLLLTIYQRNSFLQKGVGIDLAEKMLEIGRQKIHGRDLVKQLSLQVGDATNIPFPENSFDAVTIAFGIRNVENLKKSLEEMYKVLKSEGRAIILEFSLPANRFIRAAYLFYFRKILPMVGGLISGDKYAYQYLNKTVESFPYGNEFCDLMKEAGFQNVRPTPLTFGIATIYQGDKKF